MKPTYHVRVWQEDSWWLARVVAASEGADPAPLNAITQARSLPRIEAMGRDLIATILDADGDAFDLEVEHVLPDDAGELVGQAKGARTWLDAAQDLWHERSTAAARALADQGYSLRETATLLGLSHQRVDQILGGDVDHEPSEVLVFQWKIKVQVSAGASPAGGEADVPDADGLLVVRRKLAAHSAMEALLSERIKAFVREAASQASQDSSTVTLESVNAG